MMVGNDQLELLADLSLEAEGNDLVVIVCLGQLPDKVLFLSP